jgi:membrane protease YdiL (CAAX protease family)
LFVCFYVATLFVLEWLRFPLRYWIGLVCVVVATSLTVAIWERGRWPLGLFIAPRMAAREFAIGIAWGIVLIGSCAILIVLSTNVRHAPGRGFPWLELMTIFVPAAVHEELLFRGYPFQKLLQWNRAFAYLFVAFVFAALHVGNTAVTFLGLTNVFLGGVLLGLAYEGTRHLWFPIGLHLAWNLMSGPVLGHEVSGYTGEATLFVERGGGLWWLTGGNFGIEGSVCMTAVELAAIAVLARQHMIQSKEQQ